MGSTLRNGAAAKINNFDRLGKKVRPGTFPLSARARHWKSTDQGAHEDLEIISRVRLHSSDPGEEKKPQLVNPQAAQEETRNVSPSGRSGPG